MYMSMALLILYHGTYGEPELIYWSVISSMKCRKYVHLEYTFPTIRVVPIAVTYGLLTLSQQNVSSFQSCPASGS